jgi:hypothetical protein
LEVRKEKGVLPVQMRRQGKAEAHRKCRGFIDGSGEMASLRTDGLVAERGSGEVGMIEGREGFI